MTPHLATVLAQLGNREDTLTGAVSIPVYRASTYSHPALGESTGYDYTRSKNPTRDVLEDAIARLEGGVRGYAFASGMSAVHAAFSLLAPDDHVIASDDLYGGTYRLFEQWFKPLGMHFTYVDMADPENVRAALTGRTRAVFIESPTNPTMAIADIAGCAAVAKEAGALTFVDNTFLTPYFQRPVELGADVVLHSATKYLGGHNDILAGLAVAADGEAAERLEFAQNAVGGVLGPDDAWLVLRGMKTLALRMERHQENALAVSRFLLEHPRVERVFYPGIDGHPGKGLHDTQASGYGGMLSFEVADERMVAPLLAAVRVITFAESLGSVESLITFPARQTHADIPREVREAHGVTDRLLRLSVGIEAAQDIIADLAGALAQL